MRHTRRRVLQLESLTSLHSSMEEPIENAASVPLPEADPLVHEDDNAVDAAAAAAAKKKKKKKEEEREAYLAVASLTHPHDLQLGSLEQQSKGKGSPLTLSLLMRMMRMRMMRKKKKKRRRIFAI